MIVEVEIEAEVWVVIFGVSGWKRFDGERVWVGNSKVKGEVDLKSSFFGTARRKVFLASFTCFPKNGVQAGVVRCLLTLVSF